MNDHPPNQESNEIDADVVTMSGGSIENIEAETVRIDQGGAQRIIASEVGISRGGVGVINADNVDLQLAGALTVRSDKTTIKDGGAGVVVSDQLTGANANIGVAVANTAELNGGSTVVLLAREVHGDVETMLDTRGTMVAGLIAGIAVGLVLFVGSLLVRRR